MKRYISFAALTLVLVGISVSAVFIHRAAAEQREGILKQDLRNMRGAIDSYTWEKKREPLSLGDLVAGAYLQEIPEDPVTSKADWVLVFDHPSHDKTIDGGLVDVHSASELIGSNGLVYSDW